MRVVVVFSSMCIFNIKYNKVEDPTCRAHVVLLTYGKSGTFILTKLDDHGCGCRTK